MDPTEVQSLLCATHLPVLDGKFWLKYSPTSDFIFFVWNPLGSLPDNPFRYISLIIFCVQYKTHQSAFAFWVLDWFYFFKYQGKKGLFCH